MLFLVILIIKSCTRFSNFKWWYSNCCHMYKRLRLLF